MNEVLDLSFDTTASTATNAGARSGIMARQLDVQRAFGGRERPGGGRRWSGSLCASDLQCLVSILEDELIPQMLRGYSPAGDSPDDRFVSP